MNPPTPAPTPEQAAATELLRQKLAHALEQKRSREVNHMLKGASFRPPPAQAIDAARPRPIAPAD